MSHLLHSLNHPVFEARGWSLLHFVWQGAVLAGLLAITLIPLRRASAHVRYLVECLGFVIVALCPLVTWCWLLSSRTVPPAAPVATPLPSTKPAALATNIGPAPNSIASSDRAVSSRPRERFERPTEFDARRVDLRASTVPMAPPAIPVSQRLTDLANPLIPWLVGGWMLGVALLSFRLLLGWRVVQRIKRRGTTLASDTWQLRCRQLAARLKIRRPVKLVESVLVEVPTLIGWLRPMILLPVSTLAGLEPSQLEAILAHELAHIRRHDYLVNLIQTALETLLFYHPAVWWVSRQIRHEREHCCDDIAVEICGSGIVYARALAEMETLRSSPRLTLAATDGKQVMLVLQGTLP